MLAGVLGVFLLSAGPAPGQDPPLKVWAAASTGEAVGSVLDDLQDPGRPEVRLNLDGTSRLALQLSRGAPADVFVSADRQWMDWAVERQLVDAASIRRLARNRLVLVAPADRPAGRPTGADAPALSRALTALEPGARIGLAGAEVPAGRYAREALAGLGLLASLRHRLVPGGSVRTVVEWVARGEVTLGLVYASDARGDPRLRVVAEVPGELHRTPEILAALTRGARPGSRQILDALAGARGRAAFAVSGFLPPEAVSVVPPEISPPPGPGSSADRLSTGSAIRISVQVALLATLLALVPAVWLGWLLARRPFPGKTLLSALVLAPMVVPPVVTGFILLAVLGQDGPLGRLLIEAGIRIPFSFVAAVLAAAVVGFPLFVVTVRNAFETVDPQLEEMSATLGARPWQTFRRISLPLALPGIGAGAVLAFARGLGEFGATVVLAGNVEGETRTIALAVYTLLESPRESADIWVLVGASVLVSVLALAGFEYLSRRQRRLVRRNPDG